jgi:hypothetical protein
MTDAEVLEQVRILEDFLVQFVSEGAFADAT